MSEDGFFNSSTASRQTNDQQQHHYYHRNERQQRSPNITPASTVLNSPDLTNEMNYLHLSSQQHHMVHHPQHSIKVGRSPVSHHIDGNNGRTMDGGGDESCDDASRDYSPENATGGRFIDDVSDDIQQDSHIVFDDIGDHWCKQPVAHSNAGENVLRQNSRIIRKYPVCVFDQN